MQDVLGDILGMDGGSDGGNGVISKLHSSQIKTLAKFLNQARFTLPHKRSDRTFSIKSISRKSASEMTLVLASGDGASDKTIGLVPYLKLEFNITIENPCLPCVVYGSNYMAPLELVVLSSSRCLPLLAKTGDHATNITAKAKLSIWSSTDGKSVAPSPGILVIHSSRGHASPLTTGSTRKTCVSATGN